MCPQAGLVVSVQASVSEVVLEEKVALLVLLLMVE